MKTENPNIAESKQANFTLPSEITIKNIEDVKSLVSAIELSEGLQLTIDAAATNVITTSGVQLLLSIDKSLEKLQGRLFLLNASQRFNTIFEVMGFKSKLKKWSNCND